jgi:hypothetical protein
MKTAETTSWIFLATAISSQIEPVSFAGISQVADGINHAIPTQKEMQNALSWLTQQKLVAKVGNKYSLTESGKRIYEEAQIENKILLKMWKSIEDKFVGAFGNT